MGDFAFRITPNIILGSYTLSRLPQQVMEWGTRFMIIADPVLNEFDSTVLLNVNVKNPEFSLDTFDK